MTVAPPPTLPALTAVPVASPPTAFCVWACVVIHNTSLDHMGPLLTRLLPQVARVVVCDNSPATADAPAMGTETPWPKVDVLRLPQNPGTGAAYNRVWAMAQAQGVTHLLLLDQDSMVSSDHVAQMLAGFATGGEHLAAIGPRWMDPSTHRLAPLLSPIAFFRHTVPEPPPEQVAVDHLISSGSVVCLHGLRAVGGFDESLFLDYTDIEWCVRARQKGWGIAVQTGCLMQHELGSHGVHALGRRLAVHPPWRTALQIRNHCLLWRKPHMPWGWLLSDAWQLAKKVVALLLLAPQKTQRGKAVVAGLRAGGQQASGRPPHV